MNTITGLGLSLDVEDWGQSTWDRSLAVSQRAADNTLRVLDILAAHDTKITAFVLGKFAERFPSVVKRIHDEGHEVAAHGFGHVEIFRQTPDQFADDVLKSINILQDITGEKVEGYRAPDFSVVRGTLWALDILAGLGLKYDSSIFPIRHKRYGIPTWPARPIRVKLDLGRSMVELPIATCSLAGRRIPVAGGGYHRLLPSSVILWAIRDTFKRNLPFLSYCHPYEFDPRGFYETDIRVPFKVRVHQGLGRSGFEKKFRKLLTNFRVELYRNIANGFTWDEISLRSEEWDMKRGKTVRHHAH